MTTAFGGSRHPRNPAPGAEYGGRARTRPVRRSMPAPAHATLAAISRLVEVAAGHDERDAQRQRREHAAPAAVGDHDVDPGEEHRVVDQTGDMGVRRHGEGKPWLTRAAGGRHDRHGLAAERGERRADQVVGVDVERALGDVHERAVGAATSSHQAGSVASLPLAGRVSSPTNITCVARSERANSSPARPRRRPGRASTRHARSSQARPGYRTPRAARA